MSHVIMFGIVSSVFLLYSAFGSASLLSLLLDFHMLLNAQARLQKFLCTIFVRQKDNQIDGRLYCGRILPRTTMIRPPCACHGTRQTRSFNNFEAISSNVTYFSVFAE